VSSHHTRISSSLHGNFQHAVVSLLALATAACGDAGAADDENRCANPEEPVVLEVENLMPAYDETVPNQDIVHAFTVPNATGTFTTLSFAYPEAHTAGAPGPMPIGFTPTLDGADVTYTFSPVTWAAAEHVEIVETGEYTDSEICFILPRPLFAYDVTEPE
jgi:hypothetical protein